MLKSLAIDYYYLNIGVSDITINLIRFAIQLR